MKKTIKKLLFAIVMLIFLLPSGCKKDDKTPIDEGETIELTVSELEKKINDKESFILVLKSIEDEASGDYLEIVDAYTKNAAVDIYYLDVNGELVTKEVQDQLESALKNMPSYESDCLSVPSTVLVINGVIKNAINGNIESSKLEEFVG